MKIIHFSRDYTTHDHRFLSKMVETGEEIFFLQLERGAQQYEDRPVPEGVTRITWRGGQGPVHRRDAPRLIADLKRVIRRVKPDLIQAGPVQRGAFLTALAGYRPLITMSWGYDLLHDVHRGPGWEWATRYTLKRSAAFVGDCETIRKLAQAYGMPAERIMTFPWGANIRKFQPHPAGGEPGSEDPYIINIRERKGWGPEIFVLLSTRSWAEIYGVDELVQAFARLAGKHPELRLLMLGSGPLAGKIHSIIHSSGLGDRVHFPGQINQRQLPAYYRAADLYISTSHSDGTSISLLEALASGTPVLLTDIPGNREWVTQEGELGWTYPDGDVNALERGIQHALENRDKLAVMGSAARSRAEERGDWEKNFPKLLEAWRIAQGKDSH